jgi:hypothetical protein
MNSPMKQPMPMLEHLEHSRTQLRQGSDKARRQAVEQLLQMESEGWPVLLQYLQEQASSPDGLAGLIFRQLQGVEEIVLQKALLQAFPLGLIVPRSDRQIDYQPLQDCLIAEDWEAADRLTAQKLCELAGPAALKRKWIYFSEVQTLPVTDLQTLDQLWRVYSEERFGFSVQRRLWLNLKGDWDRLWPQIGWKQGNAWTRYPSAFTWALSAPIGHLPLTNQLRGVRVMDALMNHPAWGQAAAIEQN